MVSITSGKGVSMCDLANILTLSGVKQMEFADIKPWMVVRILGAYGRANNLGSLVTNEFKRKPRSAFVWGGNEYRPKAHTNAIALVYKRAVKRIALFEGDAWTSGRGGRVYFQRSHKLAYYDKPRCGDGFYGYNEVVVEAGKEDILGYVFLPKKEYKVETRFYMSKRVSVASPKRADIFYVLSDGGYMHVDISMLDDANVVFGKRIGIKEIKDFLWNGGSLAWACSMTYGQPTGITQSLSDMEKTLGLYPYKKI